MTVALLLAAAPDRLSAMAYPHDHPGGRPAAGAPWLEFAGDRLMSAGVYQVDVAICAGPADGLRAVAAAARDTAEPVLVCTSDRALATPGAGLAALLGGTGTAGTTVLAGDGALLVAGKDLPAVADAAEVLAARIAVGDHPGNGNHLSVPGRTPASGELDGVLASLVDYLARRGVPVASLAAGGGHAAVAPAPGRPAAPPPLTESGLVAGLALAAPARGLGRWAAACGLAPVTLTTAALALSVCAAAWLAAGSRSSLVTGSVLLCVALLVRQAPASGPAAPGNWLGPVSGLAAECAVYAGLAAGWTAARPQRAWALATVAMILLAVRQMIDGCHAAVAGPGPAPAGPGHRLLRLAGQSIALPAGERTIMIAVTASVWGPRVTLTVLIGWGAVALGYALAERGVASRALSPAAAGVIAGRPGAAARGTPAPGHGAAGRAPAVSVIAACRDDGPLASRLGRAVQGQLPPLLPAIAGVTVTVMLAALGLRDLPGPLLLAPAAAMLLAALGAGNPHSGRLDWLVPPLLQAGQYAYLAAVAAAGGVPAPATFALIAAIALHHMDVLHRPGDGRPPSAGVTAAGLGWEGRMLVAGFGGMLGIATFAYIVLAGYLWALFGWDSLTSWLADAGRGSR